MSINAKQVNPVATRVFMGTLTDGVNLHDGLAQVARQNDIQAATFEMLGGLHRVEFTAYDFTTQTRLEPLIFERAMEIVAGHGTISLLDDTLHVHIHLAVAFRDDSAAHGISVVGGHAATASAYAVEFTMTAYDGAPALRGHHEATGLRLWDMPAITE